MGEHRMAKGGVSRQRPNTFREVRTKVATTSIDTASYERRRAAGQATLVAIPTDTERAVRPSAWREPSMIPGGEPWVLGPSPVVPAPRTATTTMPMRPVPIQAELPECSPVAGRRGRKAARQASQLPLRQRLAYGLLVAIGLVFATRFAMFWFNPARLPRDFGSRFYVVDMALFGGLTFVVWHRQAMDILGWLICSRLEAHREPPRPAAGMRVAFITTFVPASESQEMLRTTLLAMQAADYPHDTWVLDEGNDSGIRTMCQALGVKHFSRRGVQEYHQEKGTFLTKSKAGNHNAWYVQHAGKYDIVAQIDSDFKVRSDFLIRTLGYFRNPRVAFVGTPQIYGNTSNWIARGAAQQTYLFYGPIMRALSRLRMSLLIGANHIVRVAALREVGWYQGHLTEDLATGMRFHAGRWESIYVPEPLAIGEGPTTWADYFSQQYRWSFGCLNIFFTHAPRLSRKMRLKHGLLYLLLEQFYFSGLAMITAIALLIMYFFFGWTPASMRPEQLALWYGPLLAWRQIVLFWLQRFNVRPKEERGFFLAGRLLTIAVIPIYFLAFVDVIRNKKVTFKTTPKGGAASGGSGELAIFKPHLILSAVIGVGLVVGVILGNNGDVFLAWGFVTASLLASFFIAAWCRRVISSLGRRERRSHGPSSSQELLPPFIHAVNMSR
jgi:cellulose synthase (UDP-forming)